jgi:photosystem II stability/assembly factor-like uncharacterized protein
MNVVFFPPSATGFSGFAIGDNGVVLKTMNGGNNWISVSPASNIDFKSIYFINIATGWITGWGSNYVVVYKTTNSGTNWIQQFNGSDASNSPSCCSFINENKGYIGGVRRISGSPTGFDMTTTNGGLNWNKTNHYEKVFSCSFASSHNGWRSACYGSGFLSGELSYTTNYGSNWGCNNFYNGNYFYGVQFLDSLNGWYIGYDTIISYSFVLATTNGGFSWSDKSILLSPNKLPLTNIFYSIYFCTPSKGWLCGTSGTIEYSSDGGSNWNPQNSHVTVALKSIIFTDLFTGYCVGNNGTILKTVTGGLTNIRNQNRYPKYFSLSQNYPNPFNPVTKIKYSVSKKSLVSIKVFDILGKEILTLVNREHQPGEYETYFDSRLPGQEANLQSGIYFYKMQANEFSETRKMLLIK